MLKDPAGVTPAGLLFWRGCSSRCAYRECRPAKYRGEKASEDRIHENHPVRQRRDRLSAREILHRPGAAVADHRGGGAGAACAPRWCSFEPGARTAWHTHPLGQTLHVVSGAGLVQTWGGAIQEIKAGDVIFFAPGEKHWHGAGPKTAMTHLAMQEALDGVAVDWLEKVSDEQYSGK